MNQISMNTEWTEDHVAPSTGVVRARSLKTSYEGKRIKVVAISYKFGAADSENSKTNKETWKFSYV